MPARPLSAVTPGALWDPPQWHSEPGSASFTGLPADCRGRWESFVEETLTETNRRNAVDLVRRLAWCVHMGAGAPPCVLQPLLCVRPQAWAGLSEEPLVLPPVSGALVWPRRPNRAQTPCGLHLGSRLDPGPGHRLTPTPLLLQVSTHHLHPSSEDEDMEGVFPNELSLQQVGVAGPLPTILAVLRPLGLPGWHHQTAVGNGHREGAHSPPEPLILMGPLGTYGPIKS